MKNIKRVCWCVRWQGYNYFHFIGGIRHRVQEATVKALRGERKKKGERRGYFLAFSGSNGGARCALLAWTLPHPLRSTTQAIIHTRCLNLFQPQFYQPHHLSYQVAEFV